MYWSIIRFNISEKKIYNNASFTENLSFGSSS